MHTNREKSVSHQFVDQRSRLSIPDDQGPTDTHTVDTNHREKAVEKPASSWWTSPVFMSVAPSAANETDVKVPNHFGLTESNGQAYGSASTHSSGVEAKGYAQGESNLLAATGTWTKGPITTTGEAQVGISSEGHAVFDVDPSQGKFVTSVSGEAFAGERVKASIQEKLGGATFEQHVQQSAGASVGGNATVNINPENHSYGVGASFNSYVGNRISVGGSVEYGPVKGGLDVSVLPKGVGFYAGGNFGINKGVLDASMQVGAALGVGVGVRGSVTVDFNKFGRHEPDGTPIQTVSAPTDLDDPVRPSSSFSQTIDVAYDRSQSIDAPSTGGGSISSRYLVSPHGRDQAASSAIPAQTGHTEVAFIDAGLPNYSELRTDLLAQRAAGRPIEPFTIGPYDDGIGLVTRTLEGRHDVSAVHVLAHGRDGQMKLGSAALDSQSLRTHADEVAGWNKALAPEADLLLYGCNVAQTDVGQRMVQNLAGLTGADVAASSHVTGSAARGGSWDLDVQTGPIQAELAPSLAEQARWQGTMAVGTLTPDARARSFDVLAHGRADLDVEGFTTPRPLLQTTSFDDVTAALVDGSGMPLTVAQSAREAAPPVGTEVTNSLLNAFMQHVSIDVNIAPTAADSRSDRDPNHIGYGEATAHGYGDASADGLHLKALGHFDLEANAFDARSIYTEGAFEGSAEFQVGMSGQGDAVFEVDPNRGKFVSSVSGSGFVGEKASLLLHEDVYGVTFGQSFDQLAGATAGSNATVNFDPTRGTMGLGGRVNAFAGASFHTGATIEVDGVKAGAGVGYMAGVGFISGGNFGIKDGRIDVSVTLGASLGVGLNFDIQLGLDLIEIAEQIHAEEIVDGIVDAAYTVGDVFEDAADTVGDAFEDAGRAFADLFRM